MEKSQMVDLLDQKHDLLISWLESHPEEKWIKGPDGKWTTGQHIRHLIQSIQPLNKAITLPKFFLKYKFGLSNRDTRSYEMLVQKYQQKVATLSNTVSPFSQNMKVPSISEKQNLIKSLEKEKNTLQRKIQKCNESHLDTYILPHPLLGRMPIREMVMFTGYHTEHHYKILKEKY